MSELIYATKADFAYEFAEYFHRGQTRKDGTEYFEHPKRVAELVRKYKGDSHEISTLIAAAYCHDLLEDTTAKYYDLVNAFDPLVASIVMELTTNPEMKIGIGSKKKYLAYKLRHMTHYALVIKLCDRYDNISDMKGCSIEWRLKYLDETIYIIKYLKECRKFTATQQRIIDDLTVLVYTACLDNGFGDLILLLNGYKLELKLHPNESDT